MALTISFSACKPQIIQTSKWVDVESPKVGFKVKCMKVSDSFHSISVKFDEKSEDKYGFLSCRNQDMVFLVHSMKWDFAENIEENTSLFFEMLNDSYAVDGSQKVSVEHDGKLIAEGKDLSLNTLSQHFIIEKTAFHLYATFEKKDKNGILETLTNDDKEIAQKFFDSFRIIK